MKTNRLFTAVIITIFAAMLMTTCSNPFLHEEREILLTISPLEVEAEASSTTSITINWLPVTGAKGYNIYRSSSPDGIYTMIGTSTTTSYTDTDLEPGTYYYKVAAFNGLGESPQSLYASTIPSIPTGVSASASTNNSVTISWNAVTGATGYNVYCSSSATGTYTKLGSTTPTITTASYTHSDLMANTTYYYKVAAYSSYGTSSQSSYVSKATTYIVLSAPTGIVTTKASYNSVTISWNAVVGADGYNVYRSTSSTGIYTRVGTTTSTSYENTGLSTSTTYYYKVAAYNSSGIGTPSSSYIYSQTQSSSTTYISVSGMPRTGQTLTVTTAGSGWSGDYIWGYATSGNANSFTPFTTGMSGLNNSSFTIPPGYSGYYIRAFRYHPSGTWTYNGTGYYIASNFLGPVSN